MADELNSSALWNTYLLLRDLDRCRLDNDKRMLVGKLNWGILRSQITGRRVTLAGVSLMLDCLRDHPAAIGNLVSAENVKSLLQHAHFNACTGFLNTLFKCRQSATAVEALRSMGAATFASKIRGGRAKPIRVAWFLRTVNEIPEFDASPIVKSLTALMHSPDLKLGGLSTLRKQVPRELRPELKPDRVTHLVPPAAAGEIRSFLETLNPSDCLQALQAATPHWTAIVARSSLRSVASLENNLRKRAKMIFDRSRKESYQKAARSRATARQLQDASAQIVGTLNSSGFVGRPVERLRTYRKLLLNAVSSDGINEFRKREQDGESVELASLGSTRAVKMIEIDFRRAFLLEIEAGLIQERGEDGYVEWAKFFWTLRRADPWSPILKREDLHDLLRTEVKSSRRQPETRLILAGSLAMVEGQSNEIVISEEAPEVLGTVRNLVEATNDNSEIPRVYLLVLKLRGAVELAKDDGKLAQVLIRIDSAALRRIRERFDSERERETVNELLDRV